jgi:hypothetical protein
VQRLCRAYGPKCTPPKRGDHYKVRRVGDPRILTVPAARPIKPEYVRQLVALVDSAGKGKEER